MLADTSGRVAYVSPGRSPTIPCAGVGSIRRAIWRSAIRRFRSRASEGCAIARRDRLDRKQQDVRAELSAPTEPAVRAALSSLSYRELLRARRGYDVPTSRDANGCALARRRELAHDLAPASAARRPPPRLAAWDGEDDGDSTTATVVAGLRLQLTQPPHRPHADAALDRRHRRHALALLPPSPAPWRIAGAVPVLHALSSLGINFLDGTTCRETATRSRCTCNIRAIRRAFAPSGTSATGTRAASRFRKGSRASPARGTTPIRPRRGCRTALALPVRRPRRCSAPRSAVDAASVSAHARTSVRREPEEAEQIARFTLQLGYDVRPEVIAEGVRPRGSRKVFVATTEDRIVGWAAVSVHEPFVEGAGAHLDGLVVDESVRSSGIGGELLAAAEAWARERDCGEMRLHSNVVRDRAHAFYRRHGYDTVKAQYYFRKAL